MFIFQIGFFSRQQAFASESRFLMPQKNTSAAAASSVPGMLGHKKTNPYRVHGSGHIQLQDHGNPVRYRNIWVRELNQTQ